MKNAGGKRTINSDGVLGKQAWASGSDLQISIHINTDSWSGMQPSPGLPSALKVLLLKATISRSYGGADAQDIIFHRTGARPRRYRSKEGREWK